MKKLYLVDVSSMFFRAFYAIPPLNNKNGLPTNALYGFLSMTIRLLREIRPEHMVFCFDRKEPSFRLEMYPEYKANRGEMPEDLVPQVPYVRELSEMLGIPCCDKLGYEADDIIGTFTRHGLDKGYEVVIVSGDKDFAQLIGPKVTMFDTMKEVVYDEAKAIEKWGVRPDQMIDYLALIGDSSDNIPGVRGIGPKTAQKLLDEYDSLDGIYENVEAITAKAQKKKLIENKEMAYLSQKLVTIVDDIDLGVKLEELKVKEADKARLKETLVFLNFKSFARTLLGDEEAATIDATQPEGQFGPEVKKEKENKVKIKVGRDRSKKIKEVTWSVEECIRKIEPYSDLWGINTPRGTQLFDGKHLITVSGEQADLGEVLGERFIQWKGYDIKALWKEFGLKRAITPAWDHMLAAYVLRPGSIDSFEKVYETYMEEPLPEMADNLEYLHCHLELAEVLKEKIEEQKGVDVLYNYELPLVPCLYHMESQGIGLDTEELGRQSELLTNDLASLKAKIHKLSGETFNIASPKQLSEILFEKMKLPSGKKTKTGFSTDNSVLEKLAKDYEIARWIIEYREYAKLKSTYVDALPQLIDEKTGRLHTHFRQAATATGRLSSVNPNLQNIPIRTDRGRQVRRAFVARPDHLFLSVDYSQIELRVLAHITKDPALVRAYEEGLDIHAATASEVFSVPLDEVTPDLRRTAKAVNFGIAYGQGAFGLAEALGIGRKESAEIIERYFEKFKNVKTYMDEVKVKAMDQGYVETVFGRRRYLPELKSKSAMTRKFGERAAINAPMQGTASDLVKKAMIDVFDTVTCPMLLQVHDELLFECKAEEVEHHATLIRETMESSARLDVPMSANVAWGKNWEDAHA